MKRLLSRFVATNPAARRRSERVLRLAERVPIIVREEDGDDGDEPASGGGAAVRDIHWEPGAEIDLPASSGPRFAVDAAGKTDPGMRRCSNEDALLLLRESSIYAVADGMGGHAGGMIASGLAVEAIATSFRDGAEPPRLLANVPVRAAELVQSFAAANDAIRSVASKNGGLADMGTTIVAARFCPNEGRLYVGHVGDSRCYRLRDGALEQITRDHTMAELGVTGHEGAFLSRAVGPRAVVEADVTVLEPRAGDVYLLCTDGLTKMLSHQAIRDMLLGEEGPAAAAASLIARANGAGGRDNLTALIIRISAPLAEGA